MENDTYYYILIISGLFVLFFVIRYSYLIDRWLNKSQEYSFEGKPWPLITGLLLGFLIYLFGITKPEGLEWNISNLIWQEYAIMLIILFTLLGLLIESFKYFKGVIAIIRMVIWTALTIVCILAGLYAGLLVSILLAIAIVVYFIFFWKKRLTIK
jgi:uncharacterized membrane protein